MNAIQFEKVSKTYRLHHENYQTITNQFNGWLHRLFGKNLTPLESDETFYALKNVSLVIQEGEFVGILGANGAGKTTLLRLIANITKPTRGCVSAKGRIAPLIEIGVGFHPELTGRENIYLNGVILRMTKSEVQKKLDEIVSFSELEKFIDCPIKQYSMGMLIRLGFSVAIHSDFDILLADEILAVGDRHFQEKCLLKFEEMKRAKKTLIFISHSIEQLKKYCENGFLFDHGTVVYSGKIEDVCNFYANQNRSF